MMAHLSLAVPRYERSSDPIFHHATPLHECELHTTSRLPMEKTPKTTGSISAQHEPQKSPELENSCGDDDDDDVSMGSVSQDVPAAAASPEGCESKAHPTDLIASNDSSVDEANAAKELASNTYRDKENVHALTDDDVKPANGTGVRVKTEPGDGLDDGDGQSNLSVISDQSGNYIVPEASVKMEEDCDDASATTVAATPEPAAYRSGTGSSLVVPIPTLTADTAFVQNNALQWYFGRNPWSDLSLFDILTQKPIFFAQPVLGFGSHLVTYPSLNSAPVFGSFFNYAMVPSVGGLSSVSVSAEASAPLADVAAGSSSTAEESTVVVRENVGGDPCCVFCFEHYASRACQFYAEQPSNEPLDAGSACLCCGGDEDDEQADGEETPQEENADKTAGKANNVNPGWFGKGYRKKIKKRKG